MTRGQARRYRRRMRAAQRRAVVETAGAFVTPGGVIVIHRPERSKP